MGLKWRLDVAVLVKFRDYQFSTKGAKSDSNFFKCYVLEMDGPKGCSE
jgi:hypothetical protein